MAEQSNIFPSQLGDDGFPLDRIELTRISAQGNHGALAAEQQGSQPFSADVTLYLDTRQAAATDQLGQTTDYSAIAQAVYQVLSGPHVDLIETLAEQIAATVLSFPGVTAADVAVHKPEAPLPVPVADVTVAIRRDRTHRVPAIPAPMLSALPAATGGAATLVGASVGGSAVTGGAATLSGASVGGSAAIPFPAPSPASAPVSETEYTIGFAEDEPQFALPEDVEPEDVTAESADQGWPEPGDVQPQFAEPDQAPPVAEFLMPVSGSLGVGEPGTSSVLDAMPAEPVKTVLALGSNLGDSKVIIRKAIAQLQATPGITIKDSDVGPLARTSPVGGPAGQGDFFNTVAIAYTTLSPNQVLAATQQIENQFGRDRTGEKWGPRTLDIDLITYGDLIVNSDDLTLPHSLVHQRAFVLLPWSELEAEAEIPGLPGHSVTALANLAPDRGGIRNMMLNWLEYAGEPLSEPTVSIPADAPFGSETGQSTGDGGEIASGQGNPGHQAFGSFAGADQYDETTRQGDSGTRSPLTALTPTPKLDLPEWHPAMSESAVGDLMPTFTGILTGVSAKPDSASQVVADSVGNPTSHPVEIPDGSPESGATSSPTFTGSIRAESPLAARLAARIGGGQQFPVNPAYEFPTPPPTPLQHATAIPDEPAAQPIVPKEKLEDPFAIPSWDQIVHG